jgi:hypothetical protein
VLIYYSPYIFSKEEWRIIRTAALPASGMTAKCPLFNSDLGAKSEGAAKGMKSQNQTEFHDRKLKPSLSFRA